MATTQVETVSSGADKAKLAAVAALVVAAIAGFYLLSKQGPIVQWLVLLVGLAAAAGTFLVSEPGKRFVSFAQDAWREVKKVVWPTRKETMMTAVMVVIMTTVLALFFLAVDSMFETIVRLLLGLAQ